MKYIRAWSARSKRLVTSSGRSRPSPQNIQATPEARISEAPRFTRPPGSTLSTLFPELIDEIVTYLNDDRESLRYCALISPVWSCSVQRLLFRTLTIFPKSPDGFVPFLRFLESSPHIRVHIRSLTLNGCFLFDDNHICSHLLSRVLAILPPLRFLKLHCTHFTHAACLSSGIGSLCESQNLIDHNGNAHSPIDAPTDPPRFKVDHLRLDLTDTKNDNIDEFLDILELFSDIHILEVFRDSRFPFTCWTETSPDPPIFFVQQLRSIGVPPLLGILHSSIATHSLHTIDLSLECVADIDSLGALLVAVGPNIRYLRLNPTRLLSIFPPVPTEHWKHLGISMCTRLQHFELMMYRGSHCYCRKHLGSILDILASVPMSTTKLTLHIHQRFRKYLDWSLIEQTLLHLNLDLVVLDPWVLKRTEEGTECYGETHLPKLYAKGLLTAGSD